MNYRLFGKTGMQVSELGLGTCFMAEQGQENVNRCVDYAIEHGVNYFDTAADYGQGNDERMLGIALQEKRDKVILATKVGYTPKPSDHRNADGLMSQFEDSLRRLQTDYVDIIQVHEADFRKWWINDDAGNGNTRDHSGVLMRDDEEYDFACAPVVEFLRRAKASGKARFIGLTAKNARLHARLLEAIQVDSIMTAHQFNPIYRNACKFLFPLTEKQGIGAVLGATVMKGWIAVPQWQWREERPEWMDDVFFHAYFDYLRIWEASGIGLAELSLRWMLSERRLHSLVCGFSGVDIVAENIAAVEKGELLLELRNAIDAVGVVHPLIYQNRQTL